MARLCINCLGPVDASGCLKAFCRACRLFVAAPLEDWSRHAGRGDAFAASRQSAVRLSWPESRGVCRRPVELVLARRFAKLRASGRLAPEPPAVKEHRAVLRDRRSLRKGVESSVLPRSSAWPAVRNQFSVPVVSSASSSRSSAELELFPDLPDALRRR